MNTMSDYSCYCTPEQTKKALELGAPIDSIQHYASLGKYYISGNHIYDNGMCYFIPSAEQMIGWLEEKGIWIHFCKPNQDMSKLSYGILDLKTFRNVHTGGEYNSRKEATLAAIDAALEYLTNNNNYGTD